MLDGVIAKLDDSKAHLCNEYSYWNVGNRLSLEDDAKLWFSASASKMHCLSVKYCPCSLIYPFEH